MTSDDSLKDAAQERLPGLLLTLALLVIITGHTQLTVRHLLLRASGVRLGEIHKVLDPVHYTNKKSLYDSRRLILPTSRDILTTAVVYDPVAVFIPGELKGELLFLGNEKLEILDNTETHILVRRDAEELAKIYLKERRYRTGYKEPGLLVRLALSIPGLNVTLSDIALGLLALCIVIWAFRKKKLGDIDPPTLMILLLIGACVASLIPALRFFDTSMSHPSMRAGIKELLQYIEVFVVAWAALAYVFRDRDGREIACWALGLCAGLCVLLGVIEYTAVFKGWTLHGLLDVMQIDSVFGIRFNPRRAWMTGSESSKNVLATYLLIVLPFLTALVMACKSRRWRYALTMCILLGLCLVLHAWLLVCVLISCLFVLMLDGRRKVVGLGILSALTAITLLCLINSDHGKLLLDSVALHRTTDVYGLVPMPMKGKDFKGDKAWQQKFSERQAAMNAVGFSPVLGLGIGNYQAQINQFFANSKVKGHDMEKSPQNLMEYDSHSLYQVQTVETGIVGLLLLVLILVFSLAKAIRTWQATEDPLDKAICAGAAGTAVALLLGSVFCSFLTRGVQLLAIAIIVMPYAIARTPNTANSPDFNSSVNEEDV